jgi:hypothetical protein
VTLVEADTVILDGSGTRALFLPAAPVVGDPVVTVGGEQLVLGEDYLVSRRRGILYRRTPYLWPSDPDAVTVTYGHGYDETPDDVAAAVLEAAKAIVNVRAGLTSLTVGGETLAFGGSAVGTTTTWETAVARYSLGGGA